MNVDKVTSGIFVQKALHRVLCHVCAFELFFSGTLANSKGEFINNQSSDHRIHVHMLTIKVQITEYMFTNCNPHTTSNFEKHVGTYIQNQLQLLT